MVEVIEAEKEMLSESITEPIRKLVSIRRISDVSPVVNSDFLDVVTIDGWKVVTQKENNFKINDLVVYFETDSFLPVCDEFEFLRDGCFKSTKHLGDGFRIKTKKLRGQISQGLILPLSTFKLEETDFVFVNDENQNPVVIDIEEGADLTKWLGVKKWEKPLDPRLAGVARGNFPSFIRKTDQERVQNLFGALKNKQDQNERWEATLKLDGSSMTVYLNEGTFGVCSRNLDLKETEDNTFWQVARKLKLEEKLRESGGNFALQGELMGPGIQGNREGLFEHDFFLFDIWDIDNQRYLTPAERLLICASFMNDLSQTPMIGTISLRDFNSVDDFLAYADRSSINHKVAEGVVFKRFDGADSFKVINNRFLLSEKD